jgi:hypothetical protein
MVYLSYAIRGLRQCHLLFDRQTPPHSHANMGGGDQRGAFLQGNIAGNANEAAQVTKAATKLPRVTSPLAGGVNYRRK